MHTAHYSALNMEIHKTLFFTKTGPCFAHTLAICFFFLPDSVSWTSIPAGRGENAMSPQNGDVTLCSLGCSLNCWAASHHRHRSSGLCCLRGKCRVTSPTASNAVRSIPLLLLSSVQMMDLWLREAKNVLSKVTRLVSDRRRSIGLTNLSFLLLLPLVHFQSPRA